MDRLGWRILSAAFVAGAGLMNNAIGAEPSVPYVPTPQVVVDRMLQMARVTAQDYLIDLGSGDGRIVVTSSGSVTSSFAACKGQRAERALECGRLR